MLPILRDRLKILRGLQYGGGVVGKVVEQLSMERGRQAAYSALPIMEYLRKIRIEIDPVVEGGVEVWPGKTIESVDVMRDDVKLLHYMDAETVPQAENITFSEAAVIGIEDLVDPGMYDNFTDIILRIGKVLWLVDTDARKAGEEFIWLTIINVAQRGMRVYYNETLVYESTHPAVEWKKSIWELEQIAPPPVPVE